MKSNKMPYIIYADIESLIQKIDNCKNNPGKSFTAEIEELISWGYSMSTIWLCDHIEKKHSLYCREDCMKKFCESLREHTKNIIDFEKKKCKYKGADCKSAVVHSIRNIRFNVPNEIPVVFHNSSNYDYHFIIKELHRNLKENLNVMEKILKSTRHFQL